jgi:two-component system, chemotaxis family, chemotaxis protein CheY
VAGRRAKTDGAKLGTKTPVSPATFSGSLANRIAGGGGVMTQTILLVDDSRTMREVLKVYLMGRDFEFIDADGGERALSLLRLVPVSLVIVDLKMPKMDGLTFLRHLRSTDLPAIRTVPVVLVTADKSGEWQSLAKTAGADAFLQKPLDSARAVEVVNRLLPGP